MKDPVLSHMHPPKSADRSGTTRRQGTAPLSVPQTVLLWRYEATAPSSAIDEFSEWTIPVLYRTI